MTLSPADPWKDATQRSDPKTRFLLEITDGVTPWKATSGECDLISEPEAILEVESVESKLDPVTREPSSGSLDVIVEDDWLRPIYVNNQIKHQKAIVTQGAKGVAEANFLSHFAGPIEEIMPEGGKKVVLRIEDIFSLLEKIEVVGLWMNQHPLEIMEDLLSKADIPAAFIDATSFDPSQAVYADIRHFVISRGGAMAAYRADPGVNKPTSAFKLISELGQLIHGQLRIDEDGKIGFALFDASAASADSWGVNEIRPGSFEQLPQGIIINQVNVGFFRDESGKHQGAFTLNDTASQTAHAYPGSTNRILSFDFETSWLDNVGAAQFAITSGFTGSYRIFGMQHASGTRDHLNGGVPAGATIASARPAYLFVFDPINGHEIIKAETLALSDEAHHATPRDPETDAVLQLGPFAKEGTYSDLTRGVLGTNDVDHVIYSVVIDITILVELGSAMLSRWKNEAAIIKLRTDEGQGDKQTGDFIDITWPDFLAFGKDGLSGDTFEITSKRYDKGTGEYEWGLAEVLDDSLTLAANVNAISSLNARGSIDNIRRDVVSKPIITSGLVGSIVSGLNGKITAGEITAYPEALTFPEDQTYAFTANKDTFVSYDTHSGDLHFYIETTGAGLPTKPPEEAWVAKFVAGAGLTSVDNTIKNTDALVDSVVTEPSIAVDAVTTPAILADAVTNVEVLDGTLAPINFNRRNVATHSMVSNASGVLRTRG